MGTNGLREQADSGLIEPTCGSARQSSPPPSSQPRKRAVVVKYDKRMTFWRQNHEKASISSDASSPAATKLPLSDSDCSGACGPDLGPSARWESPSPGDSHVPKRMEPHTDLSSQHSAKPATRSCVIMERNHLDSYCSSHGSAPGVIHSPDCPHIAQRDAYGLGRLRQFVRSPHTTRSF